MMDIEIRGIRRDGGTQSRASINTDIIAEYAERMRFGTIFPPVTVFFDGHDYWLADGFHRVAAATTAGLLNISADVQQGSRRDAILYSVGVNANHGLRRTNDDKRRAVGVLLRDAEWRSWSDRKIADQAGVDHKTVGKWRFELVQGGEIPHAVAMAGASVAGGSSNVETDKEYSPGVADTLDVESARQIAIRALNLWPTKALEIRVENGEDSDIEGIPYRIGKGQVIDAAGVAHKVGVAHIAVAMTSNNGAGVYRFDARKLAAWVEAREDFVRKPEVLIELYGLFSGHGHMDYSLRQTAEQLGVITGVYGATRLSVFGKSVIERHLSKNPNLKLEHEIRFQSKPSLPGELGKGIEVIEILYKLQKKDGAWGAIVDGWQNQSITPWAKALAERGYLIGEKRMTVPSSYSTNSREVWLYVVSPSGAELIGRSELQTPPPPPELLYHPEADTFVDPSKEFTLRVGDTVKFKKDIGRVEQLLSWPAMKVKKGGQNWAETWYENNVALVELDEEQPNPVDVLQLDAKTASVWRFAQTLLKELTDWGGDASDGMSDTDVKEEALSALEELMSLVADTYSGQRLKLEMPSELDGD